MKKFTTAVLLRKNGLLLKDLEKEKDFIVKSSFEWLLNYYDKEEGKIVIEEGFRTDFGSIPRWAWFILNPTAKVSYILHDYIFEKRNIEIKPGEYKNFGLMEANNILFQALRAEGYALWKSCLVWLGLFIGSWWIWYDITKKIKKLFSKK